MARHTLISNLYGTKANGDPSSIVLRVSVGTVSRMAGLVGSPLRLTCVKAEWPEEWDLTRRFTLEIGRTDLPNPPVVVILGGYRLIERRPAMFSAVQGSDPVEINPGHYECLFDTVFGLWRDSRGGLLRHQTFNPLGADGRVDPDHDDYRTMQELADLALDAMDWPHVAAPSALNVSIDGVTPVTPPGPLDWGNARALPELEALLSRVGWTAVLNNMGDEISLLRLRRAGEPITVPAPIEELAEPYELSQTVGVRASRLVITSGRTRTTIISERSLDHAAEPALVWCTIDEDGQWADATAGDQLEIFQGGPVPAGGDGTTREFATAFTAVRLAASERAAFSGFVTLPEAPASSGYGGFAQSPCMVWMRGANAEPGGQFENVPALADDPIRVDGAQAVAGDGVFVLPTSIRAVKFPGPEERGAHAAAIPLDGEDLVVRFAHEARTGIHETDYYVSAWIAAIEEGVLNVTQVEDPEEVEELVEDPATVKIEAPFLRRVMVWEPGDDDPTPFNDDQLNDIAKEIALARASADLAMSGEITLRGIVDVAPGAIDGAVTAVFWDLLGQRTILAVNQHEVPQSFWDQIELRAGRSIAGGVERKGFAGSAAGLADVRSGSTPGDLAGVFGGGGGAKAPEAKSGTRGRERAVVEPLAKRAAPEPASAVPNRAEAGWVDAVITGHSGGSANRWTYEWAEAAWNGTTYAVVTGGKSSDTHGLARNLSEFGNDGEGDEAPGWDTESAVLPVVVKPIMSGTHVRLTGPRRVAGDPTWFFDRTNAVGFDLAPVGATRIKAKITGSTLIDGQDYGWLYDWVEMEHNGETGWVPKVGGRSSGGTTDVTFTADPGTNKITTESSLSALPDGAAVQFSTTSAIPAPLVVYTNYYGRWATEGSGPYTLYPTSGDALANTNAIDLTTAGTGTHTLTAAAAESGKARNFNEHLYLPTPPAVFAPGYTTATIPPGFAPVAIGGEPIVTLEGPYTEIVDETPVQRWYFSAENAIDGECGE